jgi:hypothetical protein
VGGATQAAGSRISSAGPSQTQLENAVNSAAPTHGTEAYVADGAVVDAGEDIEVTANEDVEVEIIVGGLVGGFVGIGAGVSVTNISANTSAHAAGTLSAGNNITVNAELDEDLDIMGLSGSTGFVGLGAAVVVIGDSTLVEAYIGGGTDILSAQEVSISATADQTVEAFTGQISAGAVATGASFVNISIETDTLSYIGSNTDIGQSSGTVGSVSVK